MTKAKEEIATRRPSKNISTKNLNSMVERSPLEEYTKSALIQRRADAVTPLLEATFQPPTEQPSQFLRVPESG